ncbi:MAG: prolyl oligopeptidase family serine peptidase [Planctomycetota bacterium]
MPTPGADQLSQLPRSLAEKSRLVRLAGDVPTLLAHPDWDKPAPVVFWMHGRTASKELDPGRYSRWIRAGLAACAIDLPSHGERADDERQRSAYSLDTIEQARAEIDPIIAALARSEYAGRFDLSRIAIGGMSLGGMVALRRLCDPHHFRCAAVEATTGDLAALYDSPVSPAGDPWPPHEPTRVAEQSTLEHLGTFEPIPLLALHSETDRMVPFEGQRAFLDTLRAHYTTRSADPELISLVTWPETGAPEEHIGFGRVSNDAKNTQTRFLADHLLAS